MDWNTGDDLPPDHAPRGAGLTIGLWHDCAAGVWDGAALAQLPRRCIVQTRHLVVRRLGKSVAWAGGSSMDSAHS